MNTSLEGRVALVTGSGRGIGRAVALELAKHGCPVALLSRSPDELDVGARAIREHGGVAITISTDVAELRNVQEAVTRVIAELGSVDILINNAAVVEPLGPTINATSKAWLYAFAVNVEAPFHFSRLVLPLMLEKGWGRIVNVSSAIAAHPQAMVGMNAYAATKAALEAHTLNLATELNGSGVTANLYRPGSVDTAMQRWIRSRDPEEIGVELHARFVKSYDMGTLMTPSESARSLLTHLQSDETGSIWDAKNPHIV